MYKINKNIPLNNHTEKLLSSFPEMAKAYAEYPVCTMPYSLFTQFHRDGNRVPYEEYYNERRRRLNVLYFSVLIGHKEFIPPLEDMLNAICEEYTWALPAHVDGDGTPEKQRKTLDLFAAETAGTLAQLLYLSSDWLSKGICDRIKHEIYDRIIEPALSYSSMPFAGNWAAVCANGLVSSMVYLGYEKELNICLPVILKTLDNFLDSYQSDGCCTEGRLYWSYGFGNFVYAVSTLRDYTNGKIDYFKNDKVYEIAKYGFYTYLGENITLPYSDGPHRNNYNIGLFHFLKNEYPSLPLPDESYELVFDEDKRYRFSDWLRNIYWYNEAFTPSPALPEVVDYNETQCYIRNKQKYSFSCKGGHNDESHNHNDIGSFIIVSDGEFILDDLGWPEYDKNYFSDKRYENICASSLGHGVPIINGIPQSEGIDYNAEVIHTDENIIKMNIGNAYPIDGLEIIRTFELRDNSVIMSDKINTDNITERFITRIKPEIIGCNVKIGDALLIADTPVTPTITSDTFATRHVIESGVKPLETAYMIDFCYSKSGEYTFTICLQKA